MRHAIEPSIAVKLGRWVALPSPRRLRRPSPLPTMTIVPTRSSYFQRFLWLFSAR